jgi:hypothetical protein
VAASRLAVRYHFRRRASISPSPRQRKHPIADGLPTRSL